MIGASSNPRRPGVSGVPCADDTRRPALAGIAMAALLAGTCLVPAAAWAAPEETEAAAAPSAPADDAASIGSAFATLARNGVLDGVIALVDGEPLTMRDLHEYGVKGAPFLPPAIREDRMALLQTMIERRLLKAEYEKNGIAASDAMVERYIAGVLQESGQSRAELDRALAEAGLSYPEYFERMREEVQRMGLVNMLIRSRVNVPDEEVERVWETDPDFLESEKLEVAVIYLPLSSDPEEAAAARALAVEVREAAEDDFAAAARKYSKGPGASEGGNLGEFERGSLAAHFEQALEGLDEGEVSVPVEGSGGIYIVKLVDVKSSARRPYEEVKEELREKIYEKRMAERYQKWANEDLRRDHNVNIVADDLARLSAGS